MELGSSSLNFENNIFKSVAQSLWIFKRGFVIMIYVYYASKLLWNIMLGNEKESWKLLFWNNGFTLDIMWIQYSGIIK